MRKDKILVLCVDRDNDVGEKAGIKGPIVGKEEIIKAATQLGLADPEDSDFNTMFQAVRVFEEMQKQHESWVAVLTGDKNVGTTSDRMINHQLNQVLKGKKASGAILVTDGAEDEHILPIIQSKVPILSVSRVKVKQSEMLESSYYKIKDFIQESLDNPKFSRLVFGLPAIIFILYALFGFEGWRAILGVFGVYLLIKGFRLEHYFTSAFDELKTSLTRRRFAFFMYIVAIAFVIIASFRGWIVMVDFLTLGIFEAISAFISASIYFYFIAGASAWVGRNVGVEERLPKKVVSVPLFGLAVSVVIYNAAELILRPEFSLFNFIFAVVFGFALLFLALLIEWKI